MNAGQIERALDRLVQQYHSFYAAPILSHHTGGLRKDIVKVHPPFAPQFHGADQDAMAAKRETERVHDWNTALELVFADEDLLRLARRVFVDPAQWSHHKAFIDHWFDVGYNDERSFQEHPLADHLSPREGPDLGVIRQAQSYYILRRSRYVIEEHPKTGHSILQALNSIQLRGDEARARNRALIGWAYRLTGEDAKAAAALRTAERAGARELASRARRAPIPRPVPKE